MFQKFRARWLYNHVYNHKETITTSLLSYVKFHVIALNRPSNKLPAFAVLVSDAPLCDLNYK